MSGPTVVVAGAGPAGLTAAHELIRHGVRSVVIEQSGDVGGLARTETYKGYRVDIGGHRFYTKVQEVQDLWEEVLGDEFLHVRRLSRIYYNGRFFDYPLSLANAFRNLGLVESLRILGSYCYARLRPPREQETFEDWVVARFGRRLFRTFFKTYTEKVWGIACTEIRAEWAAQRIKGLSLTAAVANALFGARGVKSLIGKFRYPRLGPGQMWERFRQRVEAGGSQVRLRTSLLAVNCRGRRVCSVTVGEEGGPREVPLDQLISSVPVSRLLLSLRPAPPPEVLRAARGLKYRDFLIVLLIVGQAELFPDNWIYIHSPEVRVGRIQNFKNWSADMVPDANKTGLGMEYFCSQGDDLWTTPDDELVRLAARELHDLGLADSKYVEDGHVIRQTQAYPVYDGDYRRHLAVIRDYLAGFENLQTVGRNGMHRYNNQDHSMLCGLYAARNMLGGRHDLWDVNTERSYYEEQQVDHGNGHGTASCPPNGEPHSDPSSRGRARRPFSPA